MPSDNSWWLVFASGSVSDINSLYRADRGVLAVVLAAFSGRTVEACGAEVVRSSGGGATSRRRRGWEGRLAAETSAAPVSICTSSRNFMRSTLYTRVGFGGSEAVAFLLPPPLLQGLF